MWHIRYSAIATACIYRIPRGPAALVTAAIKALVHDPTVGESIAGRPNAYRITPASYTVAYELIADYIPPLIMILSIE